MKKIVLLLVVIINTIGFVFAQEENEIESFFDSKPEKIRGYIAPLTNITYLDGEATYMTGVNGAAIINDHYILGFYKVDLENDIRSNNTSYIGNEMDFDHKGLWLGYIFMPKRIAHININAQLGKGNLEIYDDVFNEWIEDDLIFIATPSIEAEFNIAKFLRVGVGANYRFTFDVDKFNNYNNEDFSDFGAFISFKFGWFN